MNKKIIRLSELIAPTYKEFFNTKKTYVVCKGSRASGKSKAAALWIVLNMMKYPLANTLCVRQFAITLRDSVYADIKWAIHQCQVDHLWNCTVSPLEIIYIPTGQKILFRGMDDGYKLTSITVDKGILCWCLVEEAYQILREEDFDILDESIRGKLPEGYFKRMMLIFNPWQATWLKSRFFDVVDENILAMTTTYLDNPWLSETDRQMFERMKRQNPKRYRVAGEGEFGLSEGQIFENWEVQDLAELIPTFSNIYHGCDFGVQDANACISVDVEIGQKRIYIFDEYYRGNITLETLSEEIKKRIGNRFITCDGAWSQNIIELNDKGIWALPARKGPDSIRHGILWLQDFEIIIHKDCVNTIKEFGLYRWDTDKFGNSVDKPVDKDNHSIDALRYAVEPLMQQSKMEAAKRI